jgi:hypothetical protein
MKGKGIQNFIKYRKVVPLPPQAGEVNRAIRAPREKGAGVITTSIMEGGDII